MRHFFSKSIITIVFVIAALVIGVPVLFNLNKEVSEPLPGAPAETPKNLDSKYKTIGLSVEGRLIESYTFGRGKTHLLFVGGIHGGYEWNSVLLSYKFMDYLSVNPGFIPSNLTVTVIPSANPDGVYKVIGKEGRFTASDAPPNGSAEPGRFNAHKVDLNRNFDCKWQPEGMWKGNTVSGGTAAFSEPEARAIRNFVQDNLPAAVIFWHSQANAVYASECQAGILPATLDIMRAYSKAAGYPANDSFDAYQVTGDAEGWLASIGIPAITVELVTHETIEWERNLAGIKALFEYYSAK